MHVPTCFIFQDKRAEMRLRSTLLKSVYILQFLTYCHVCELCYFQTVLQSLHQYHTGPVNGCYHINMKYFQQHVTNVSFDTITHLYSYPHYVYQILFSVENIAFNFLTFLQRIWLHYEVKIIHALIPSLIYA